MTRSGGRSGWHWFWLWAVAGWLTLLAVVSIAIGLFVAPFAFAAMWLAGRHSRSWPESLGLIAGFGALCLFIAYLNWNEGHGADPFPWLAAGTVLALVGVVGYALASPRYGRNSSSYARR